jgi:opacity protein-like surface antigen
MRTLPFTAIAVAVLCVTSSASAQEPHAAVQAFGGLGLGSFTATNTNFGGAVRGDLTPNIQVIGEAGRLGNVLPSLTQTLFDVSPVDFNVSAWYGQGGVRFTGGTSGLRPYAEASAGIARLQPHVTGFVSGLPGVITNAGLALLNSTAPIASVGGGVTFESGAFIADIGYRRRRIFSDGWVNALALGNDTLSTNEVRVGFGVRF